MKKKREKIEQLRIEGVEPAGESPSFCVEEENFTTETGKQISIGDLEQKKPNLETSETVGDAIIDTDAVSERLEEAKGANEPKKKKKSIIWNLVFLAINIVFMVFVVRSLLKEASGSSLGEVIAQQGNKLYWLFGALGCFIGIYLTGALSLTVFLKNTTGKRHFWLSLKVTVLGKYYDFITPMAVGGQPSQILNLIEGGISPGVATSIPIIKMIINQLVRWFLIIVLFIFVVPLIPAESGLVNLLVILLKILGVIGIIVTTFVSMSFLFLGSSKIVGKKIAKWAIRIGYKLKLVKNYRKSYDKFMRQVIEYQSSMKYLAKNKSVLIRSILYYVLEFILYCSLGFFTSMAFSPDVAATGFVSGIVLWVISLARYQVVDMASTIMVLPGGTGIKEIAFLVMFNFFFKNSNTVAWSFLSWRMFDYYLFLAVGFIVILTRIIISIVKNSKRKKKALAVENAGEGSESQINSGVISGIALTEPANATVKIEENKACGADEKLDLANADENLKELKKGINNKDAESTEVVKADNKTSKNSVASNKQNKKPNDNKATLSETSENAVATSKQNKKANTNKTIKIKTSKKPQNSKAKVKVVKTSNSKRK